jgi:hypothetical protein
MQSSYTVKRKRGQFEPIPLVVEWETTDDQGNETTKTERFMCKPFLPGQLVLELSDLLSRDGYRSVAVSRIFGEAIVEDDARRWRLFTADEDAPDVTELVSMADDLLTEYGNRSGTKRRPTQLRSVSPDEG